MSKFTSSVVTIGKIGAKGHRKVFVSPDKQALRLGGSKAFKAPSTVLSALPKGEARQARKALRAAGHNRLAAS